MSAPTRVVLDTNVVLSALLFGGKAAGALRQGWQQGAFTPLVSTATVQELMRVLAYPKFRLTTGDQQELLADFLPHTTAVRIPEPPPPVPDCRDPFDLPFLHLAVAGKARWLVSGDRDLLVLADAFAANNACRVVTLEAFMQSRALK
ncbi:putative toxin-antitoxin system toxin component, PIN family [Hydrogenophaga sp.]|jgi:putative PIN family toxin of toxin-antitoxin system|uniref:putative toxin-antitoxin system toxin component, PIN family n=1 Tax=Hydrogenophaga sp. TaxID=1904254 RepID=UPI0025B845B2|nr:putative toxin-antitoxin system toxin component, PIN family [Hydrogenophaga sp.]MDP1782070.1 putative toxin-antitoxin system toxin component, PIN family [Hydrogenophaga sp.]MDP2073188.1 putative toxin-antitoxin system toxin component, PIN family [Hydrogenophaga sp.]MDP3106488.1 putative toxin-antitoxin system toxin component, PIN family [Hydrogenophaga sp.]MDZ4282133.1 putative toxin-antitoxin system toxin component, PIN family [Hydrogenophaga sp.]